MEHERTVKVGDLIEMDMPTIPEKCTVETMQALKKEIDEILRVAAQEIEIWYFGSEADLVDEAAALVNWDSVGDTCFIDDFTSFESKEIDICWLMHLSEIDVDEELSEDQNMPFFDHGDVWNLAKDYVIDGHKNNTRLILFKMSTECHSEGAVMLAFGTPEAISQTYKDCARMWHDTLSKEHPRK